MVFLWEEAESIFVYYCLLWCNQDSVVLDEVFDFCWSCTFFVISKLIAVFKWYKCLIWKFSFVFKAEWFGVLHYVVFYWPHELFQACLLILAVIQIYFLWLLEHNSSILHFHHRIIILSHFWLIYDSLNVFVI